jgi:hypothetical protein
VNLAYAYQGDICQVKYMNSQFEQMMEVNIRGRVMVICQNHGVRDPTVISFYTEVVQQAISAMMTEETTPAEFHDLLTEQADWLTKEVCQIYGPSEDDKATDGVAGEHKEEGTQDPFPKNQAEEKKTTGYIPEAKSMSERLKDKREEIERLLLNDCVTLKLVSPSQAKKMKQNLVGKVPEKAEEEIVAELRNALHSQIRKFLRKHNGGPWGTATLQAEVRMDIIRTRTVRSLVSLSRQLLEEREAWLSANKTSLTGRLFGGKLKFDN